MIHLKNVNFGKPNSICNHPNVLTIIQTISTHTHTSTHSHTFTHTHTHSSS